MIVRLYCHIGHLTGYGRASREILMSLLASGIEVEIRPLGPHPVPEEIAEALEPYRGEIERRIRKDEDLSPKPDAIIVHTLPLDCEKVMQAAEDAAKDSGFSFLDVPWIAYTTWEATSEVAPQVVDALREFDQIWVPSTQTAHAFDLGGDLRQFAHWVKVIPHAFDAGTLETRKSNRIDGPWRFYYVGAWTSRKNPMGLLRAWAHTFEPDEDVQLILDCPGAQRENFALFMAQTALQQDDIAPVVFRPHRHTNQDLRIAHAERDVFVSATRGEAWNLPAFDAMLAGRHIIHPGGTGADDYLGATSAALYGGGLSPAYADVRVIRADDKGASFEVRNAQGLSSRATWLEPDLMALGRAMRSAFDTRTRDLSVLYSVAERYSYEAVGKLARTVLEAVCD